MSEEEKVDETKEVFILSDDTIAMVRELVMLCILTQTNIVDHLRAIRLEVVGSSLIPTEEYIQAYNQYVEELSANAEEKARQMQQTEATDAPEDLN